MRSWSWGLVRARADAAGSRVGGARAAAGLVAVTAAAVLGAIAPGAALAVSCGAGTVSVAPLHGTRFYTDSGASPALSSGYTGVSVTSTSARSNVWVSLSGFSGGLLGLNANQPAAIPVGDLGAGSTVPAYFFLTASTLTTSATAQSFTVTLYQGNPSRGGTAICSYADGYSGGVYDAIQAAANKVQDVTGDSTPVTVSTSSPVLGGLVTLTVEGTTGTLGQGPDGTPFIYETPTSLASWPADAFRLIGTTLTLSPGAGQTVYTDKLEVSNASWSAAQSYIAQYTFRIVGTTSSATSAYPIQEITSGTQVKHTNVSTLAGVIPAVPPATNPLTVSQTPSVASLPSSGGNVDYTLGLQSSSATSSTVDELVDTLPAGASYVAGSAKLNGGTIADPTSSSGTLVFPGPFAVSSAGGATLTYRLALPGSGGTYVNSAVGYVGSTTIDTTASTSDSAPATATVTVASALQAQTITFPQPADTRVDQGPVALGATASSGLAVSYSSSTTGVCTVSGSSVTLLATGTCTIAADQAGDGSYTAAATASRSFQVTAAPVAPSAQTITFPQPADTRVDQGPVALGATASSGLAVSYTSSTPSICTVSGSSVTLLATGTCTIAADQAGNGSYSAAATVSRSFQVTAFVLPPTGQTITFSQPADTRVDQGPVTLGATASSGLAVTYSSSTPSVCTVSGSTASLLTTGTCTIAADQAGDGSYTAATTVSRSFQVTAAPVSPSAQTISFPQPADTRVDQGPVALGATASSGLAVSYSSSTTGVCTVSGSSVTLLATGTCTIAADQAGNGSYSAATTVSRSFQVTAAPVSPSAQTITYPQPADERVDQGPVTLGATSSSGLAVSYASSTPSICTVSGSSVTLLATGTCTIAADQAGNGSYSAATTVSRSFQVTAAPVAPSAQTIGFPQPADTRVDQGPVSLAATASSGLAVSFASSTPSICTVSGSTVSLLATGTCTIAADQTGNGSYSAATTVSHSFQVTALPPDAPAPPPVDPIATPVPDPPPSVREAAGRTTAGETTTATIDGLPVGATVVLAPAPFPAGVANVKITGSSIAVTAAKGFSGVVSVPVLVVDGGTSVATTVTIVVRPAAPVDVTVEALTASSTRIAWLSSPSAHGYEVRIGGRVVCRTTGSTCVLPRLLTATEQVVVTALGGASTRSVATVGRRTLGGPLLLAVVHFATDSYALSKRSVRTLVAAETKIRRYGFTHAYLTCHTDNAGTLRYNVALSRARCAAVARFVRRRLGIATVTYTESAFAYLRPVAPNTSPTSMARNRRVEISVR